MPKANNHSAKRITIRRRRQPFAQRAIMQTKSKIRPIFGRGVTERNTSLHSGSIDSVQTGELFAKGKLLHLFEAHQRDLKVSHQSEALPRAPQALKSLSKLSRFLSNKRKFPSLSARKFTLILHFAFCILHSIHRFFDRRFQRLIVHRAVKSRADDSFRVEHDRHRPRVTAAEGVEVGVGLVALTEEHL